MPTTETLTLNMGPHHPSTHGVLRLVLELEGETVVRCKPVIGYLHTGIEKTAEVKTYQQAMTLFDRMDYTAGPMNAYGYCLAVEKLLGIEVPPRARVLRVILAELSRIAAHLVALGSQALDIGATTVFLYAFREREMILDLFDMSGGGRMFPDVVRIGGLASYFRGKGPKHDLPPEFLAGVQKFIDLFPGRVDDYEALLTQNPIWLERTQGVGVISGEDALALGLTGPTLRGSGVYYDVRKAKPYGGYEQYDFEVPLGKTGDVFDRYLCRVREMRQSAHIIRQALANLPDGPINVDDRKIVLPPREELYQSMESLIHHFKLSEEGIKPPAGAIYQAIESPKGELGYYIVSNGSRNPWRVHVRSPSFVNLQGLPRMAEGRMLADLAAIIASIDIVLGEVDR